MNAEAMSSEKRIHERKNLDHEQVPGIFQVGVSGEVTEFNEVNDVSISGMGIMFPKSVSVGQSIKVSYHANDFRTDIEAEVVWKEKIAEDKFRLGIEFSNKNMDGNIMLFMALREYIDDFA